MKTILTAICIIVSIIVFAQTTPPNIQRQGCLGAHDVDVARSIQQTTDGGYIIAGSSDSHTGEVTGNHGGNDYWIVKQKKNGNIEWQKSLGGSNEDYAYSIQQTKDGGYIVAGSSSSNDGDVTGNHGGGDYWIVKLDATGNIQWQKSLGGQDNDDASSIQQTTDGGYIVAGSSNSDNGDVTGNHDGGPDYWIVKLDSIGNIQWQRCLGGLSFDYAYSIQQTTDGGYIVAGTSESYDGDVTGNHGSWDYWIVKLNVTGKIQWQKSLGGSDYDQGISIQQTADSGYIVAGDSYSINGDVTGNHGDADYWIVKLNKTGKIQWQKSLGGSGFDIAFSIQQTAEGGYIVAGYSASNDGDVSSNHGGGDDWIVKLNKHGTIRWQKSMGGTGADFASSIHQTTDSGYIVSGYSGSHDGDVSGNHGGEYDYWIVKLGKDGTSMLSSESTNTANVNNIKKDFSVYPNPAKNVLHVQINGNAVFSLINSSGKIVLTKLVNGSSSIAISALPAGNYYLKNNNTGAAQKVVIER